MKTKYLVLIFAICFAAPFAAHGQGTVVVNDPTKDEAETEAKLSVADDAILKNEVLPKVKKRIKSDVCEADVDVAGHAHGAFSRPGARQVLVFYQYCQTGNGFGWVGLMLIENGKLVGSFLSESGWSASINSVPDINRNGLDEFVLSYTGGLHQGQGGVGADLIEFSGGMPKGLGWFQAESFGETEAITAWKVTAAPGKTPVFYKQKYFSGENQKFRRVGGNLAFKLGKPYSTFEAIK